MLLAAGIFVARGATLPASLWYVCIVISTILALLLRHRASRQQHASTSATQLPDVLIQLSVLLLGAYLFSSTVNSDLANRLDAPHPDYPVRVYGWVVTPSNPTRSGFSFVFQADSILTPAWSEFRSRELMVYVGEQHAKDRPEAGVRLQIKGTLERFPRPRNPGENDYGASLGLQGISGIVRASEMLREPDAGSISFRGMIGAMQDRLYSWIDFLHPGEHAAFVKGIILGYRADLPEDLKDAFMVTGTVHILAVSGSNVALIGLIVMVCSGFLRIGRGVRVSLTIIGMLFYMLITGGGPSITRATIMGIIVVLLVFLPRRGDVIQALGISCCVLLCIDARNLFDAGFLLSFASVIWIVTGSPVVSSVIARLPEEFRESDMVRSAVQLCGISILAQFGTIPISALLFGEISLVSVLANLVVVPLSAVVLLLGVTELALFGISPVLALPYAEANGLIIDVLLGLVRLAAQVPFASIHLRLSGLTVSVLFYSLFSMIVWVSVPVVRKMAIIIALVCSNILIWTWAAAPAGHQLDWLAADVGQGDAHIILTPSGKVMMIDAGPQERTMDRTILPLLDRMGVKEIDWLILSHPHWDHTAGLSVLLDQLPVRTLAVTDSVRLRPDDLDRMDLAGTQLVRLGTGDMIPIDQDMRAYVLHPNEVVPRKGWNDNSLVLLLQYHETRILFTGDLEEEGELPMVERYGDFLRSDLLKVGHHGSKTSSGGALLDVVRPERAVISVAWRNRFGHPSAQRESVFRSRGISVQKTSDRGATWWRSDGKEWASVSWTPNR